MPERERAGRGESNFGVAQTITRAVREVRRLGCFVLRNHEVVGWKVCRECEVAGGLRGKRRRRPSSAVRTYDDRHPSGSIDAHS